MTDPSARRRAALMAFLAADERCREAADDLFRAAALGVSTRGLIWAELVERRRAAGEAWRAAEAEFEAAKAACREAHP